MTAREVMARLEAAGTAQNRKVYARHGMPEPMFGVSFAELGRLAKAIGRDHALARELWQTGNADARHLACLVADPREMSAAELDAWVADSTDRLGIGMIVKHVALPSRHCRESALAWKNSARAWTAVAGWRLVALAADPEAGVNAFADDELCGMLAVVEKELHESPNFVREAMNDAIIGIGVRGGGCLEAALVTAERVGRVSVDYGETGCQTPDAASYIRKTLHHRAARAARARAKRKR